MTWPICILGILHCLSGSEVTLKDMGKSSCAKQNKTHWNVNPVHIALDWLNNMASMIYLKFLLKALFVINIKPCIHHSPGSDHPSLPREWWFTPQGVMVPQKCIKACLQWDNVSPVCECLGVNITQGWYIYVVQALVRYGNVLLFLKTSWKIKSYDNIIKYISGKF